MKLLAVIPPSTLILVTRFPESLLIASQTSHVLRHGASNIDLTRWPFYVLEPKPIQRPRASSLQYGEKIPWKAGTKYTSPQSSTVKANASRFLGLSINPTD